ncbi:MAG: MogA/MoaB family molybdenum cofactor biosynthesis protein [Chloroflexi bacterium]|nr:MogA/MoaB family molybdenum cofactor biosynthesis protein [Chloroflexota bacterium]
MSDSARSILVLTVSDSIHSGEREDKAGTLAAAALAAHGWEVRRAAVPDEVGAIREELERHLGSVDVILTAGGTGLSSRDVTPDATLPLLERTIPGIPDAIRMLGRSQTPAAILSRGVAGVAKGTLIVNLPGGSGAVRDGLAILLPVLEHASDAIGERERS